MTGHIPSLCNSQILLTTITIIYRLLENGLFSHVHLIKKEKKLKDKKGDDKKKKTTDSKSTPDKKSADGGSAPGTPRSKKVRYFYIL